MRKMGAQLHGTGSYLAKQCIQHENVELHTSFHKSEAAHSDSKRQTQYADANHDGGLRAVPFSERYPGIDHNLELA